MSLQEECKRLKSEISGLGSKCDTEIRKRFGDRVRGLGDIEVFYKLYTKSGHKICIKLLVILHQAFAVNRTFEELKEAAKKKEEDSHKSLEAKKVGPLV